MILKKAFRSFSNFSLALGSKLRIFKYSYKSNGISIKGSSFLERNVSVEASNDSKVTIINSYISEGTHIKADNGGTIFIKDSFIGKNCVIVAIDRIEIHENCQVAEMVVIRDQNHLHHLDDTPVHQLGFQNAPVIIGSNVWLGAKASVLQGVKVGKNSVVGAHSLVLKDIREGSVNVGVPSKEIAPKA